LFGWNERNSFPECRLGNQRVAELERILDERLQLIRIAASLDERKNLVIGILLLRTLLVEILLVGILLVVRQDCPFAVAITPARLSRR
jgi:hypothetical protein